MIFKKKSKEAKKKRDEEEIKDLVNQINEENESSNDPNVKEIAYTRATFWKRCSIILFDLICCALLSMGSYMGLRAIIDSTPKMSQTLKFYENKQLESGLFYKISTTDKIVDAYEFQNLSTSKDKETIRFFLDKDIENYFNFLEKELGKEERDIYFKKYEESQLNITNDDGVHLFIRNEENKVVRNPDNAIKASYLLENFYKPFIKVDANGIFLSKIPHVYEAQKYISNYFFFLEIPLSLFIGFLVVYYIIPLCFYRGKQTLGRLLFHTGLVDSRVLSVSFGRFTARFAILFFVEVLLSLVTLGIPIFVSFSLMAFSKKKQNFHDYMLGIEEVDVSSDKIFKSMDELIIKPSGYDVTNFKPVDK